ncbi:hypothetical protein D3C81_1816910 [compost metagenome]
MLVPSLIISLEPVIDESNLIFVPLSTIFTAELPETCCVANDVTFTEYVPATALSPAVTIILVVSELVAEFLVKVVLSERAVAASFRVAIFVFSVVKKFL